MNQMVELSFNELIVLGKLMNAQYINYIYLSHADDMDTGFDLLERDVKTNLSRQGYIYEDFTGNIKINNDLTELLKPVFFGKNQSSLTIIDKKQEKTFCCNFHFYKEKVVSIEMCNNKIILSDGMNARAFIDSKMEETNVYDSSADICDFEKDFDKVSTIFLLRSVKDLVIQENKYFCYFNGNFYLVDDNIPTKVSNSELNKQLIDYLYLRGN